MGWYPITTAPRDGTVVRVRVNSHGEGHRFARREIPWRLFYQAGRWRYHTTGAPAHPWHQPLEWTFDPRSDVEEREALHAIEDVRGSLFLPSEYPRGRLGPPHGVRSAKASIVGPT